VARLRDERRIYLVEQIGANGKKDTDRKRLAACGQDIDQGDAPLHSHLHAQASLSANHPNGIRRRHFPSCSGYEGAIESRSRVHPHRAFMQRHWKEGGHEESEGCVR
jgi:hypothetical protein